MGVFTSINDGRGKNLAGGRGKGRGFVFGRRRRGAWPCGPSRLFGLREALWCARRRIPLPRGYADSPKGVQGGNEGKRVPSGHNRRRRLATGRSGKQQAERTACGPRRLFAPRKAPSAPAGAYPLPRWGLTRRLRRGLGLAVPRGAHTFLSVAKEKCAKESQRHGDSRGGPPRCASRASSCGSPSGCPRPRFASLTRREKGFYCPF